MAATRRTAVYGPSKAPVGGSTSASAAPAGDAAGGAGAGVGALLTLDLLRAVCPATKVGLLEAALPGLVAAAERYGITTPARIAAWVAQLAHESDGFRALEEYASGEAYEGRRDLGNIEPGDGRRYRGRSWVMLTGRSNYRAAGLALVLPLEERPELATTPEVAALIAGWYWQSRWLNALADAGRFDAITRRINGGLRGKASRDAYHARARRALGLTT